MQYTAIVLGEKNHFSKTSFQVRMGLKKVQKQGRDERTQEDYPTTEMNVGRKEKTRKLPYICYMYVYFADVG